jgi:hypothetical protein
MKLLNILLFTVTLAASEHPSESMTKYARTSGYRLPQIEDRAPVPGRTIYRWSVAAVLTANAADAISGWGSLEANPFLAKPGGRFGPGSVALKSGFVGASLLLQHFALRQHPQWYRRIAWMNFITAGALGTVARHNVSIR